MNGALHESACEAFTPLTMLTKSFACISYCASSIASSASVASPADNPYNAGCNMACTGNTSAYCGGSSRLNVYYNDALKQSSVAGVKSSSARQVGSSTAQATTSTAAARMAKRNAKHMDI